MQFVATLAVVASVLFLAMQTRAVWREERIANQVAGTRAHRDLLKMLGAINEKFFEYPELWSYFYGESKEEPSPTDLIRLQVLAEQLADALQAALDTIARLQSYGWVTSEWTQYAVECVAESPFLREAIRSRPGIWTPLEAMVVDYDAARGEVVDVLEPSD